MSGVDPFEDTVMGRDPITKTMVERFAVDSADLSDEELCERILRAGRSMGADLSDVMTPEIVARWRPEAAR